MLNTKKEICVTILVGGKSTRMGGGIKSLKKINNVKIIEKIYNIIINQNKNIIINSNINNKNIESFKKPIIKDAIKGYLGPLAGIHASLKWFKLNNKDIKWLVSVPGDTPFLPSNLITNLYKNVTKNKKQIVLAKSNNNIHPVIGIWDVKLLHSLEKYLESGERKIILWAKKHKIGFEEFKEKNYDPFFNINYKEDIYKANKIEDNFF